MNKVLLLTVWLEVDWHCVWKSKRLLLTLLAEDLI